ncbi:30S ribosomal protein S1, partial [Striga asiatica]
MVKLLMTLLASHDSKGWPYNILFKGKSKIDNKRASLKFNTYKDALVPEDVQLESGACSSSRSSMISGDSTGSTIISSSTRGSKWNLREKKRIVGELGGQFRVEKLLAFWEHICDLANSKLEFPDSVLATDPDGVLFPVPLHRQRQLLIRQRGNHQSRGGRRR